MELNGDQLQVLEWVHSFAEDVVRPAAPEWDEREETPWPIIEEAARIGLYSFDFIANCYGDPTGLLLPACQRGDGMGGRRHRLVDPRARPLGWLGSSPQAPPSRWPSGSPSASASPTTSPWPLFACRRPMPDRMSAT